MTAEAAQAGPLDGGASPPANPHALPKAAPGGGAGGAQRRAGRKKNGKDPNKGKSAREIREIENAARYALFEERFNHDGFYSPAQVKDEAVDKSWYYRTNTGRLKIAVIAILATWAGATAFLQLYIT
jgi:hypothetical protein